MAIDIGIREKDRKAIAEGLSKLLADSYTLYLKTHNYHWNVTGPMFNTLHLMFEAQYTELALAVDLIAERIRALGHPAPGSYEAFGKLTVIEEETGVPAAAEMIRSLVERLPVMITPRWVDVLAQPIGIDDLLLYLVEALDVPLAESRDRCGVEAREDPTVTLTLVKDRRPGQPGLGPLERQELEEVAIVSRRHAPLLVVVGEI